MVLAENLVSMGGSANLPPMLPTPPTGNNASSATMPAIMEAPEHIASDAQLRASVSLDETGSIVNIQPGISAPLKSAQPSIRHPRTEDPELRAILLSLPTKEDLPLLTNRGDLEAVALNLEGALWKEISEVREQLDIVETRVTNLESAVDNVNMRMDKLVLFWSAAKVYLNSPTGRRSGKP